MVDQVIHLTKDGTIASGVNFGYFTLNTNSDLGGESNSTFICEIVLAIFVAGGASFLRGGKWGTYFERRSSAVVIPTGIQPTQLFGDATTLTWVVSGADDLDFTIDISAYPGVAFNKYWRVWITIYGKDSFST